MVLLRFYLFYVVFMNSPKDVSVCLRLVLFFICLREGCICCLLVCVGLDLLLAHVFRSSHLRVLIVYVLMRARAQHGMHV